MCRCITICVLVLALAAPLLLQLAKQNRMAKGTAPFLTNVWKYKSYKDIPDLTGKVVIVTGANVGLGKSSAKLMAMRDAQVVLACRSMERCKEACNDIVAAYPSAKVDPMILDLASLKSTQKFAQDFLQKYNRLDVLMLNAGIMHPPFTLTEDGIESQFQVNHLGHFYLTKLLLPTLKSSQPATVVVVSSNGHFYTYKEGVKLSLETLTRKGDYDPIQGYGQSKLCNVLFAQELDRRLKEEGVKGIYVNSLNPGAVNTELVREYPEIVRTIVKKFGETFPDTVAWEPDTSALTQVYVGTSPEIVEQSISGKYFVPMGELCDTSDFAKDLNLQKGLWEFSEKLLKDKGFSN